MNKKVLLDTSAVIALIKKEPGYQEVSNVLANSSICAVNFTELFSSLINQGVSHSDADAITENIIPEIIPYDYETSIIAGKLVSSTKPYDLSLGDRACIALGMHLELPIYTADKVWAELNIPKADIRLIR